MTLSQYLRQELPGWTVKRFAEEAQYKGPSSVYDLWQNKRRRVMILVAGLKLESITSQSQL